MLRGAEFPEAVKRDDYIFGRRIENKIAAAQMDPTSTYYGKAFHKFENSTPEELTNFRTIQRGQMELRNEIANQRNPLAGGSIPPISDEVARRLAYEQQRRLGLTGANDF